MRSLKYPEKIKEKKAPEEVKPDNGGRSRSFA